MNSLKISDFGPVKSLDIDLADLTLFVGPQASGKSMVLQLMKLLLDRRHIRKTLEQYGFIWGNMTSDILNRYFGEGMATVWNEKTLIAVDNKEVSIDFLKAKQRETIRDAKEKLFYVPAQRVICLQEGWPRFFTAFEDSVPYVLRHFSETLRLWMEASFGKYSDSVFPKAQHLKSPLRDAFDQNIFHRGKIKLNKTGKKRFLMDVEGTSLPYLAWSAGQKEFMPLLLSFYLLCPPSKTPRKDDFTHIIIEEPEMGLHPRAIVAVLLQIIDLLARNYKVIVSTHSPVVLEFAWAMQLLKRANSNPELLFKLFNQKKSAYFKEAFEVLIRNKTINTYSFTHLQGGINVKDISTLDAGNEDLDVADWGGLTSFATIVSDLVASAISSKS